LFTVAQLLDIFEAELCVIRQHSVFFATSLLGLLASIWIGGIGFGQLSMIAAETTTFDIMRRNHEGACDCSRKGLNRVALFCKTGQYSVSDKRVRQRNRFGGVGARVWISNDKKDDDAHNHLVPVSLDDMV